MFGARQQVREYAGGWLGAVVAVAAVAGPGMEGMVGTAGTGKHLWACIHHTAISRLAMGWFSFFTTLSRLCR